MITNEELAQQAREAFKESYNEQSKLRFPDRWNDFAEFTDWSALGWQQIPWIALAKTARKLVTDTEYLTDAEIEAQIEALHRELVFRRAKRNGWRIYQDGDKWCAERGNAVFRDATKSVLVIRLGLWLSITDDVVE